jgi:hypothetical protein
MLIRNAPHSAVFLILLRSFPDTVAGNPLVTRRVGGPHGGLGAGIHTGESGAMSGNG